MNTTDMLRTGRILMLVLVLGLGLWACSSEDADHDDHDELWDGVCTAAHDGFEKCENNRIQWCHVLDGTAPHFHEGLNCQALGLSCVEHAHEHDGHTHYQAFCVDESMTCEAGEFRCEANRAHNCLEGAMAVSPCGTRECHEESGQAVCEGQDDHGHDEDDHDDHE